MARPTGIESGYPVPGPQNFSSEEIATAAFFATSCDWETIRGEAFDFIVIGTGPTGVAFCEQALKNDPQARILMLERGAFWLPDHFQNLPLPFANTMGSPPTTYPWTRTTAMAATGPKFFQAGYIPIVGGRSLYWSAWCPTPTPSLMRDWPPELVAVTQQDGFWERARAFLHVQDMNTVDNGVYGNLQQQLDTRITENLGHVPSALGAIPAPIAVAVPEWTTTSFHKYSTVGTLLELVAQQRTRSEAGEAHPLWVADRCIVERMHHDGTGNVTALQTSRGPLAVGDAKVVLAMGAIPPATLLINSFGDQLPNAGQRYTGHFMSHVTARAPRSAFDDLAPLECGALYVDGKDDTELQYHVQLSAFAQSDPQAQAVTAFHNLPDAAAAASSQQLDSSKDYVVFVCATLGEVAPNDRSWVRQNDSDDPTTNIDLQLILSQREQSLWDLLDDATYQTLEAVTGKAKDGRAPLEYWVEDADGNGSWTTERPSAEEIRQTIIVHEASMLWMGNDPATSVVDFNYRPHGVHNVYVTGGGLFPTSGSWNPTLTMCGLAQDLADRLTQGS